MSAPEVIVVSGFGLNCERETARAFELAGASATILHLPDLVASPERARDARILAVPGGFSFGDHLGAGNALAASLRDRLGDLMRAHLGRGGLMIGICNGAQVLVRLGLMGEGIALAPNRRDDGAGDYECRWVRVVPGEARGPWLDGIGALDLPVAHGEGRFTGPGLGAPALLYAGPDGTPANGAYPANPNGAGGDCAALTAHGGRVLAIMPHPERFVAAHQHPEWTARRERARRAGTALPDEGDGLAIFRNAVERA